MKRVLSDFKTLIAEVIGLFGGFFWAKSTSWDYEPMILFLVSLFSLLITLWFILFQKDNSDNLKTQNKESETKQTIDYISNLDAVDIMKEIDKVSPFLKKQIEKNYIGLRVKWIVSFDSIFTTKGIRFHVTSLYKGKYPWVYFDIDIEQYSFFKIAKKKQQFLITGTIIEIGGGTFTLEVNDIQES